MEPKVMTLQQVIDLSERYGATHDEVEEMRAEMQLLLEDFVGKVSVASLVRLCAQLTLNSTTVLQSIIRELQ